MAASPRRPPWCISMAAVRTSCIGGASPVADGAHSDESGVRCGYLLPDRGLVLVEKRRRFALERDHPGGPGGSIRSYYPTTPPLRRPLARPTWAGPGSTEPSTITRSTESL